MMRLINETIEKEEGEKDKQARSGGKTREGE